MSSSNHVIVYCTDITLKNYGYRPVTVVADMIKCCEHIDKTDIDCNVRIKIFN